METVRGLVIIGPFPPPLHGLSSTNLALVEWLQAMGAEPFMINTAPRSLARNLTARLTRLVPVVRGLMTLFRLAMSGSDVVYLSVSGGIGKIVEIMFIAAARFFGMRVYLRHASFSYCHRPSVLAWALIRLAGKRAVHVVQCDAMSEGLRSLYGVERAVVISNAVLYSVEEKVVAGRQELLTVGFISNLSAEKGVFEVIDLAVACTVSGIGVKFKIAGAAQNETIEKAVRDRSVHVDNCEYCGAVYGHQKARFYHSIDVLVLPTRYVNETEAKVNHEAMSLGIPVIAYGRACIPSVVGDGGLVIDSSQPFVPTALDQIRAWKSDPAAYRSASRNARERFLSNKRRSEKNWNALLKELAALGDDAN